MVYFMMQSDPRACSSEDRAEGCGPLGRGFESLQARQKKYKDSKNKVQRRACSGLNTLYSHTLYCEACPCSSVDRAPPS